MNWTPWKKLSPKIHISAPALAETLDGGQSFRWQFDNSQNCWIGQWANNVVRVKIDADNTLCWSSPETLVSRKLPGEINRYFRSDLDFTTIADQLPWRCDPVISEALNAQKGLRILRQPLGETLLSFLCSSNKQIVHIKQICEHLATQLGFKLTKSHTALPSWETLNKVTEEQLLQCKLGYRAKYIKGTAARLNANPQLLDQIPSMPYDNAKEALTTLPGIGAKIADCVLLFGAGKLEAFPIDTWIAKAMTKRYQLKNWTNPQIAHFAKIHFGPNAGFAQQLLFANERAQSIKNSRR